MTPATTVNNLHSVYLVVNKFMQDQTVSQANVAKQIGKLCESSVCRRLSLIILSDYCRYM